MITPIFLLKPIPQFSFTSKYKENGGNPDLKALWDKGKLPTVKYGFYGDELTWDNISREHLECKSQGGTKRFGNIVLASKAKNNGRGNQPLQQFIDYAAAKLYLKQFEGITQPINGNRYIQAVKKTLKYLGIKV